MAKNAAQSDTRPTKKTSAPEVFVSPRVIDKEAFTDYAQSLRALIEQSASAADTLRLAAKEAETARDSLRETLSKGQARAEQSTKTLASIDERTTEAERAIGAAKDALATLDHVRAESGSLIARYTTSLTASTDTALADFDRRLKALETSMTAALEQRMAAIVQQALSNAETARQTLDQTAAGAVSRLTEAARTAERFVAEAADTGGQRLQARAAESIDRILLLRDGAIDKLSALIPQPPAPATSTTTPRRFGDDEHLTERLSAERKAAADAIDRLEEMLGEAEAVIGAAELASDGEDPVLVPGSLGDLLAKVKRAEHQAAAAVSGAADLCTKAETCRKRLADDLLAATARADQLAGALDDKLAAVQTACAAETPSPRSSPTHTGDLETLAAKAEFARSTTERALTELTRTVGDLSRLLEDLRPWKPLLLDRIVEPGALPPHLRHILDTVRQDLARDLSAIASGLHTLAGKTAQPTAVEA